MDLKYERLRMLWGDNHEKLFSKKVLLLGVGGVGSFCLDCLYRSGLTNITIVDFDRYDETNQNRQIGSDVVGAVKVERLKELYPEIKTLNLQITPEWVKGFDFEPYNLVLDAVDDVLVKVELAIRVHKKLISSMGSAKKTDPTYVEVTNIWKTQGDKFAAKIRNNLRRRNFNKKYRVIFSAQAPHSKEKGSFVGVTGTFGLSMCAVTIEHFLK